VTGPGTPQRGPRAGHALTIGLAVVVPIALLAGCSSGGGSKPTSASTRTTTTTRKPSADQLHASLMVTGDRTVSVVGTHGTCTIPEDGAASYVMPATDYPALGPGGNIKVFGPTTVPGSGTVPGNVTAVIGGTGYVSPVSGAGLKVRPDDMQVTLNADLSGGAGGSSVDNVNGAPSPFHIHITGTLRCT
jgi:hypothetical protein